MSDGAWRAAGAGRTLETPVTPPSLSAAGAAWTAGGGLSACRWTAGVAGLVVASVVTGAGCLAVGAEPLAFGTVLRILGQALRGDGAEIESVGAVILLQVRLPRLVLAFGVGGALAAVGVALQALLRNPLAEPYVLGISSGAAFGATLGTLFGVGGAVMGLAMLHVWAFAGGLLAILIVYRISVTYRALSVHTLLLAGVILNALFSALIMFAVALADPVRAFQMMMWLMGTITAPDYATLLWLGVFLGAGVAVLFSLARSLNVLTLGEDAAGALGVEVTRVKQLVFVVSALMTGAVVSLAGLIGFVGMVVPHAVRLIAGADHRLLLPAATLAGGAFLMVADTIARTALAPTELPVGVVTALIGGPLFMYLLVKRRAGVA